MFFLKSKPTNKLSILTQSFLLYRHAFWKSIPYSMGATLLLSFNLLLLTTSDSQPPLLFSGSMKWLAILASEAGCILLLSALIFRLYCISNEIPSHFSRSVQLALSKFVPLVLLMALYSLIILSGTMILIIPGFILSISLVFSFILILTDSKNLLHTLTTSHRLVWRNWWHTCLILSVPFLLNVILFLVSLIVLIRCHLYQGLTLTQTYFYLFLTNGVLQTLLIPFAFSTALLLLHDLKLRENRVITQGTS